MNMDDYTYLTSGDIERVRNFGRNLRRFRYETIEVAKSLQNVAKEFHEAFLDAKKANIAGSTAGVVGGTLAAVGFGLSFFTFGASLIVSAVGGGIAALGGVTSGGAAIGESVKRKKAIEQTKEILKRYQSTRNDILKECKEISEKLRIDKLELRFTRWTIFFSRLALGAGYANVLSSIGFKAIYNTISVASDLSFDTFASSGRLTAASFKATSAAAQGLHIAGGVAGILFLPIDFGFLVHFAHAVATDKLPDASRKIYDLADTLLRNCPDESDIEEMIEETIDSMDEFLCRYVYLNS